LIPAWTKVNESFGKEIVAELRETRTKGVTDFQAHVLQEVKIIQDRIQALGCELMKEAQAKGNGDL